MPPYRGETVRLAFVSKPGGSVFMAELLAAVADAVRALDRSDVEAMTHDGLVSEIADERTVAVVVPHEYFLLPPAEDPALGARTVAFGVEHPGTEEFETSALHAAACAARFEISGDSVAELAARGLEAGHFPLGYVAGWDRWRGRPVERDVDVVYLGTADERRLAVLARAARDLAGLHTELLIPPHEQMTGARPDFVVGPAKWDLLARSKVLVNLHRGTKTSLEWVRVLEAIANGCAVVTEPSDDLGPLRPGEHLLVADAEDVGRVAAELAADEPRRAALAAAAYDLCRERLDLAGPAAELVEVALRVAEAPPAHATTPEVVEPVAHRAAWLPAPGGGPWAPAGLEPAPMRPRPEPTPTDDGRLRLLRTPLDGSVHPGVARNRLLAATDEPFVAVLDDGDEPIGDALERMADLLRDDPELDAVLCPATYGETLVNLVLPEAQRLVERVYLTRGFVVRRTAIEALGGFTEDPDLAGLVDHHFWLSLTWGGGRTAALRRIGLALRPA